jgi:hypothetical protein
LGKGKIMTGNEMITSMGLRMEDPAQTVFTQATVLDALNIAQKTVVNLIDNRYLQELETIANNKTAGAGARWSTCTYATAFGSALPVRNGITGVFDETNDKWCTLIEHKDIKDLENTYLSGTATNPVAFSFDETIYVQPTSCVLIDVWYIKAPTDLTASGTECELNIALQEMVLDFAEAQLWRMDSKPDRATSAYNSGLNIVKTLNERYLSDQVIGTESK